MSTILSRVRPRAMCFGDTFRRWFGSPAAAGPTAAVATPPPQPAAPFHPPAPLYLPPLPTRFPVHASYTHDTTGGGRVLVVGDVHGCLEELRELVRVADLQPGRDMIITAGDIVGKGPKSKEVIEYIMENGFLTILGNHELFLLRCAFAAGRLTGVPLEEGSVIRPWSAEECTTADPTSALYARTFYARTCGDSHAPRRESQHWSIAASLSDEQLEWLASRPLTLSLCFDDRTYLVVHAGVEPGVELEKQHPWHLVSMRNLVSVESDATATDGRSRLVPTSSPKHGVAWTTYVDPPKPTIDHTTDSNATTASPQPCVLFGHDAARGFQHPSSTRLGLDTGCCTGKSLTGLLLPDRRLLSVAAHAMYSRPKGAVDVARPPPPSGTELDQVPMVPPANASANDTNHTTQTQILSRI